MPRKPRFFIPGVPVHIVQRGRSRRPVFFDESNYRAYLHWMKEGSSRYNCAIHAYVLMTNHIHLLATPDDKDGISGMMQHLGRSYVPYINAIHGESGSIWEGRYKSSLVHDERYLLTCMRYIELNPVRADMVYSPSDYRWSSYRCNGLGEANSLVTQHPIYRSLGSAGSTPASAYRQLFEGYLEQDLLADIDSAWRTGTPLGSERFRQRVEKQLDCSVGQARRGRPKKGSDPFS